MYLQSTSVPMEKMHISGPNEYINHTLLEPCRSWSRKRFIVFLDNPLFSRVGLREPLPAQSFLSDKTVT